MNYRSRIVDVELRSRLQAAGAVVVEGPKACGKTYTASQQAASEVRFDVDAGARSAAVLDPALVLDGPTPRLLDEWQVVPAIWNHVRRAVDDRRAHAQFILTGSAVPADDITRHSGAGRISRLRMRPMSLHEMGESTGAMSLDALLRGAPARSADTKTALRRLVGLVLGGGWPASLDADVPLRFQYIRDYLGEIQRADIQLLDHTRRDPQLVGRLLRALARHTATYASTTTIVADTDTGSGTLARETVRDYLQALARLMIVEDQPAWAPHLRSRSILRSGAKRHFVDPSLAAAALVADEQRLLQDLNLFGFLFESLVVRDLRIYAQATHGQILQYRDNTGLEIDAIVELGDGQWGAFEIKLGNDGIDAGAAALHRFVERIDLTKCGAPAVIGVITGSGYGYVRDDSVAVIPITALGP